MKMRTHRSATSSNMLHATANPVVEGGETPPRTRHRELKGLASQPLVLSTSRVINSHAESLSSFKRASSSTFTSHAGANPARRTQLRRTPSVVIGLFSAAAVSAVSQADLVGSWSVGEGDFSASIQFDFIDGDTYLFDVFWDGSITGREVFDLIADDVTGQYSFEYEVITYTFGDFLVGVGIEDDYQYGEGSPPDYADSWHYWTAEGGDAWAASLIGFSDRILSDGSRDAWVFGDFDPPSQIPGPATLALFGLISMRRHRRR